MSLTSRDDNVSKAMIAIGETLQELYDAAKDAGYYACIREHDFDDPSIHEVTGDVVIDDAVRILRANDFHFEEKQEADEFCKAYNMAIRSLNAWCKVQREIMEELTEIPSDGTEFQRGYIMGLRVTLGKISDEMKEVKSVT